MWLGFRFSGYFMSSELLRRVKNGYKGAQKRNKKAFFKKGGAFALPHPLVKRITPIPIYCHHHICIFVPDCCSSYQLNPVPTRRVGRVNQNQSVNAETREKLLKSGIYRSFDIEKSVRERKTVALKPRIIFIYSKRNDKMVAFGLKKAQIYLKRPKLTQTNEL